MKRYFTILALTIVISLNAHAGAKNKLYKSNTNLPFVEMMLNMMVVMGILDKIPPELLNRGGYQGLGYQGLAYPNMGKKELLRQYLTNRYAGNGYPNAYSGNISPFYQNPVRGSFNNPYARYSGTDWQPLRPGTCVGGSCLSQRVNSLNGLWMGPDGEMLGVKNDQFLWTNGRDQHMSGLMNVTEDHVVANVDGSNRQISYDYKVQGNELLTKDASGVIRNYRRYPAGRVLY